jgi:DNA-binding winged helix-turn-helix (wHTH) protein/TolB-like protein
VTSAAGRLQLSSHVLDLRRGELLTADGQLAGLRRQSLELLLLLGRRAGEVVGKDELMQAVWPGLVVGEGSLTQAVADIRRVLGDRDHLLVRNVARRGYLLTATPEPSPLATGLQIDSADRPVDAPPTVGAIDAIPAPTSPLPRRAPHRRPGFRTLAATAAVLLAVVPGAWWVGTRQESARPVDTVLRAPLAADLPALSIVVLPLHREGDDAPPDWFAAVLHGDLTNEVARLPGSFVIGRETASTYQGRSVDPRDVARELGVRHVVQGRLRYQGELIRLDLTLIDGDRGGQQWSETFTVPRERVPQLVEDLAIGLGRVLHAELYRVAAERSVALSPAEVSADDLAMQAFALWFRGVTRENVTAGLGLLERSVALDPDTERGWAGIGIMTTNLLLNGWGDDRQALLDRHAEATRNLERLSVEGNYTYSAKAFRSVVQQDWPAMLRLTQAWTERYRHPLAFGALGAALNFNGRSDEAVPALETALRLSPHDPFRAEWQYRLALAHFIAGRYQAALTWSETARVANPRLVWPPLEAAALARLGRMDEARRAADDFRTRHPAADLAQIAARRLPSDHPVFVAGVARLLDSLRELGLR